MRIRERQRPLRCLTNFIPLITKGIKRAHNHSQKRYYHMMVDKRGPDEASRRLHCIFIFEFHCIFALMVAAS